MSTLNPPQSVKANFGNTLGRPKPSQTVQLQPTQAASSASSHAQHFQAMASSRTGYAEYPGSPLAPACCAKNSMNTDLARPLQRQQATKDANQRSKQKIGKKVAAKIKPSTGRTRLLGPTSVSIAKDHDKWRKMHGMLYENTMSGDEVAKVTTSEAIAIVKALPVSNMPKKELTPAQAMANLKETFCSPTFGSSQPMPIVSGTSALYTESAAVLTYLGRSDSRECDEKNPQTTEREHLKVIKTKTAPQVQKHQPNSSAVTATLIQNTTNLHSKPTSAIVGRLNHTKQLVQSIRGPALPPAGGPAAFLVRGPLGTQASMGTATESFIFNSQAEECESPVKLAEMARGGATATRLRRGTSSSLTNAYMTGLSDAILNPVIHYTKVRASEVQPEAMTAAQQKLGTTYATLGRPQQRVSDQAPQLGSIRTNVAGDIDEHAEADEGVDLSPSVHSRDQIQTKLMVQSNNSSAAKSGRNESAPGHRIIESVVGRINSRTSNFPRQGHQSLNLTTFGQQENRRNSPRRHTTLLNVTQQQDNIAEVRPVLTSDQDLAKDSDDQDDRKDELVSDNSEMSPTLPKEQKAKPAQKPVQSAKQAQAVIKQTVPRKPTVVSVCFPEELGQVRGAKCNSQTNLGSPTIIRSNSPGKLNKSRKTVEANSPTEAQGQANKAQTGHFDMLQDQFKPILQDDCARVRSGGRTRTAGQVQRVQIKHQVVSSKAAMVRSSGALSGVRPLGAVSDRLGGSKGPNSNDTNEHPKQAAKSQGGHTACMQQERIVNAVSPASSNKSGALSNTHVELTGGIFSSSDYDRKQEDPDCRLLQAKTAHDRQSLQASTVSGERLAVERAWEKSLNNNINQLCLKGTKASMSSQASNKFQQLKQRQIKLEAPTSFATKNSNKFGLRHAQNNHLQNQAKAAKQKSQNRKRKKTSEHGAQTSRPSSQNLLHAINLAQPQVNLNTDALNLQITKEQFLSGQPAPPSRDLTSTINNSPCLEEAGGGHQNYQSHVSQNNPKRTLSGNVGMIDNSSKIIVRKNEKTTDQGTSIDHRFRSISPATITGPNEQVQLGKDEMPPFFEAGDDLADHLNLANFFTFKRDFGTTQNSLQSLEIAQPALHMATLQNMEPLQSMEGRPNDLAAWPGSVPNKQRPPGSQHFPQRQMQYRQRKSQGQGRRTTQNTIFRTFDPRNQKIGGDKFASSQSSMSRPTATTHAKTTNMNTLSQVLGLKTQPQLLLHSSRQSSRQNTTALVPKDVNQVAPTARTNHSHLNQQKGASMSFSLASGGCLERPTASRLITRAQAREFHTMRRSIKSQGASRPRYLNQKQNLYALMASDLKKPGSRETTNSGQVTERTQNLDFAQEPPNGDIPTGEAPTHGSQQTGFHELSPIVSQLGATVNNKQDFITCQDQTQSDRMPHERNTQPDLGSFIITPRSSVRVSTNLMNASAAQQSSQVQSRRKQRHCWNTQKQQQRMDLPFNMSESQARYMIGATLKSNYLREEQRVHSLHKKRSLAGKMCSADNFESLQHQSSLDFAQPNPLKEVKTAIQYSKSTLTEKQFTTAQEKKSEAQMVQLTNSMPLQLPLKKPPYLMQLNDDTRVPYSIHREKKVNEMTLSKLDETYAIIGDHVERLKQRPKQDTLVELAKQARSKAAIYSHKGRGVAVPPVQIRQLLKGGYNNFVVSQYHGGVVTGRSAVSGHSGGDGADYYQMAQDCQNSADGVRRQIQIIKLQESAGTVMNNVDTYGSTDQLETNVRMSTKLLGGDNSVKMPTNARNSATSDSDQHARLVNELHPAAASQHITLTTIADNSTYEHLNRLKSEDHAYPIDDTNDNNMGKLQTERGEFHIQVKRQTLSPQPIDNHSKLHHQKVHNNSLQIDEHGYISIQQDHAVPSSPEAATARVIQHGQEKQQTPSQECFPNQSYDDHLENTTSQDPQNVDHYAGRTQIQIRSSGQKDTASQQSIQKTTTQQSQAQAQARNNAAQPVGSVAAQGKHQRSNFAAGGHMSSASMMLGDASLDRLNPIPTIFFEPVQHQASSLQWQYHQPQLMRGSNYSPRKPQRAKQVSNSTAQPISPADNLCKRKREQLEKSIQISGVKMFGNQYPSVRADSAQRVSKAGGSTIHTSPAKAHTGAAASIEKKAATKIEIVQTAPIVQLENQTTLVAPTKANQSPRHRHNNSRGAEQLSDLRVHTATGDFNDYEELLSPTVVTDSYDHLSMEDKSPAVNHSQAPLTSNHTLLLKEGRSENQIHPLENSVEGEVSDN